jgi:bifunctional UDP-N-acetylglucosamine pyrophosphorylase/glucosamine-1-phosphate N-acetyltransferase
MAPSIIILAAGKGSRMGTSCPKALQKIANKPMLLHLLDTLRALDIVQIILVVGYQASLVQECCRGYNVEFVLQAEQRGTGHAVSCALPYVTGKQVLVMNADLPLISGQTLEKLLHSIQDDTVALLTSEVSEPYGLGRIVRDAVGKISAIVEHADASATERAIAEINAGLYGFPLQILRDYINMLQNNNKQQEIYLTDIIALAVADKIKIVSVHAENSLETLSVNTLVELAHLERSYQLQLVTKLQENGVQVLDPQRLDLRGNIRVAANVIIDVNVILEGTCIIESGVVIGPNCYIKNSHIQSHTHILANSVLEDCKVGPECVVGPFARLRPGVDLASQVKIGNFVELKNSIIGTKTKINHLTYIGDAHIGNNVNIGAGVVTCNYDGVNKHSTTIGDNVFVGSNTEIVAPLTIGAAATIAAGTTVLQDVPANALALSKKIQTIIANWLRPVKKTGDL